MLLSTNLVIEVNCNNEPLSVEVHLYVGSTLNTSRNAH